MTSVSTTTATNHTQPDILILCKWTNGSSDSAYPAVITNASGKDDRDINFEINVYEAEVQSSCSMTWRGEHYVFGGVNKIDQIAKIVGCELGCSRQ